MMNKSWMKIKNIADPTYIRGIDSFLEWAFSQPGVDYVIRCPCNGCMNTLFKRRINVRADLLKKGFWDSYGVWNLHGESSIRIESPTPEPNDEEDTIEEENINDMIQDAFGFPDREEFNRRIETNEEPNVQARQFYELLKDVETELYPGCKKVSKLSFIIRLLNFKCLNKWSNESMNALLGLFKEVLLEGALIPNSYDEVKKIIRDLGLDYRQIDACQNDSVLYSREHANGQSCPTNNHPEDACQNDSVLYSQDHANGQSCPTSNHPGDASQNDCFLNSQEHTNAQSCPASNPPGWKLGSQKGKRVRPKLVRFRSLDKPKEKDFCLLMSRLDTYDDVVMRVAKQLGLEDPSKIRLTPHSRNSQQPKPQPIKYRGVERLSDMHKQTSDILYYEVLDIPLPELEALKTLKVEFHHASKDEVVIHTIRLPKQSTVGDVLVDLKTKVELSHPNAELRLLEVFSHKIYKVFPPDEKIEYINDQYRTLRAGEIPEEEKNLGPSDRLIKVYHFYKVTVQKQMQFQNFREPFVFVIHEGETLADIKPRIKKKLQVPDEEFAKWKFAFLSLGRPEYLQDSDIPFSRFQGRDVYGALERFLGIEHTDNAPKRIRRS